METVVVPSSEPLKLKHLLHKELWLREYADANPESAWWELCDMYANVNNINNRPENLALAKSVVVELIKDHPELAGDDKVGLVTKLDELEEYSQSVSKYV